MSDDRLTSLYPTTPAPTNTATAGGAAQSAPTSPDDAIARRLYNAPEYRPLTTDARAMTPEERLFGTDGGELAKLEQMHDVGLREWYDAMGLAPQERAQTTAALRHVGAELGLNRAEVGEIVSALSGAWRTPVDDKTLDTWDRENTRRLSQMHGASWRESLADVDRLLSRHPDLRDIMREARITSNPRLVDFFISKARSQKLRGAR